MICCTREKLNHISLFMNASSSLLKIQICVVIKKKKKKKEFGLEKSDLCLLNKTKSFDFFKKIPDLFLRTRKKLVFGLY